MEHFFLQKHHIFTYSIVHLEIQILTMVLYFLRMVDETKINFQGTANIRKSNFYDNEAKESGGSIFGKHLE